jgi:predicted NBD/HSP70 family sugar kinase
MVSGVAELRRTEPIKVPKRRNSVHTENTVLLTLLRGGGMTQRDICSLSGLSQAAVTNALSRLMANEEVTKPDETTKPVHYSAIADKFHLIGVSITTISRPRPVVGGFETMWKAMAIVTDRSGKRLDLSLEEWLVEDANTDYRYVVHSVGTMVNRLATRAAQESLDVRAIGIEMGGHIDRISGTVVYAPGLNWHNVSLSRDLQEETNLPVFIENDANALALREGWSVLRTTNFALVLLSDGIGSAVVANRRLLHGATGGAGELGHIPVDQEYGKPCRCGHKGCIETVASYMAMRASAREMELSDDPHVSWIVKEADAGAIGPQEILFEAAKALSQGIIALVCILQPEEVIVSSTALFESKYFKSALRELVLRGVFETCEPKLIFMPTSIQEAAAGATWAAILKEPRQPALMD